jgi:DNA-binding FadR family transcriptional regulator
VFIEKNTVQLAAIRATKNDVSHLQDIIRRQEKAFENGNMNIFGEMDAEFHLTLARASKNSVLAKFLEIIREILKKFILEVSQFPGSIQSAIRFHKQILEHIVNHDSKKAGEMVVRHLLDVTKRIEQNLEVQMDADNIFKAVKDLEGDKFSNI